MLAIILEVIDILSCHLQLQEEHKDPCIPDKDTNIIEECSENKSCFKWSIIMWGTINEVIVILSCPLQLQEEHQDPFILDQDNYIIQESSENKSCSKLSVIMLAILLEVIVILFSPLQPQEEHQDPLSLHLTNIFGNNFFSRASVWWNTTFKMVKTQAPQNL